MKVRLTFSNGSTLELQENQLIVPIKVWERNGKIFAGKSEPYKLDCHVSEGLIVSVLDLFCNCMYFSLLDNRDKVYSVSTVVTIENI